MKLRACALLWTSMSAMACGGGTPTSPGTATTTSPATPSAAATFTLSGVVQETSPSPTPPLAGASVEITQGPQMGQAVLTDANGAYSFSGLSQQTLALRVSLQGYETEITAPITVSANTRMNFGLGSSWPTQLLGMLQRLPLPSLLKFKRAQGSGLSSYVPVGGVAGAGVVIYVSPAPATGELGSIAHELCHAHQDRVRIDAGKSTFTDYYDTAEGKSFIELTGWRLQNGAWVEPTCEQWSCGYANPIEDSAQSCATYTNPEGYQFAGSDYMQRYAPRRHQWATRWLPTP